jgi:hypothetical protein
MDSNPYKSPTATNELPKSHSRLMTFFDIGAMFCAATPFIWLAVLVVIALVVGIGASPEQAPSDETMGMLLLSSVIPWLIGGVYNLVAIIRGRRWPFLGLAINILSFALFVLLFIWGSEQ